MRERIERCRRLAKYVNDRRTTEALLEMAEQGEIDLARLIEEREARAAEDARAEVRRRIEPALAEEWLRLRTRCQTD